MLGLGFNKRYGLVLLNVLIKNCLIFLFLIIIFFYISNSTIVFNFYWVELGFFNKVTNYFNIDNIICWV